MNKKEVLDFGVTTVVKAAALHNELEKLLASNDVRKPKFRYDIKKASQETKEFNEAYNEAISPLREEIQEKFKIGNELINEKKKLAFQKEAIKLNKEFEYAISEIGNVKVELTRFLQERDLMELESSIPNLCYDIMVESKTTKK